jgi:hypothetical protein
MSIRFTLISILFAAACTSDTTPAPIDTMPEAGDELPAETCSKCSGIQMPDTFDPANLCEASQPLFDAVTACVCGIPEQQQGKCLEECAATICNPDGGGQPDDPCANCVAVQCGPETGACLNDV